MYRRANCKAMSDFDINNLRFDTSVGIESEKKLLKKINPKNFGG